MLVTYKPGEKHLNADFFSRLKHHPSGPYVVKLVGSNFNSVTTNQLQKALADSLDKEYHQEIPSHQHNFPEQHDPSEDERQSPSYFPGRQYPPEGEQHLPSHTNFPEQLDSSEAERQYPSENTLLLAFTFGYCYT